MSAPTAHAAPTATVNTAPTVYKMLFAISLAHLLNDALQAVVPALLPILEKNLTLTFTQIGMILLVMNFTASVLQPIVGYVTDRKSRPFLTPIALLVSGVGMLALAFATGRGVGTFTPSRQDGSKLESITNKKRRTTGTKIPRVLLFLLVLA